MSFSGRSGSEGGLTMPARLRNLYQAQKPDIKIALNSKQRTYTTLDRLDGTVTITAQTDIQFDDIEIDFVGTSRTFVDRLTTAAAISGRTEAFHQFLELHQPQLDEHFPSDRIFLAGRKYEFPFVFVIPQQLLPRVCQHNVASEAVREAHLQLPPTFGDKDAGAKGASTDDMAPEMSSVRYGVFTRISRNKEQGGEAVKTTIASKARRLRVMPSTPEQPPLHVRSDDEEYTMRREKTIRKGLLKGKQGRLIMEATQPPSLQIYAGSDSHSQTMATVSLRFDPGDGNSPPRLGSLASKLKIHTFFACTARKEYPVRNASAFDISQGLHTEQLNLSSRCVANVEWTKHSGPQGALERRDSAFSMSGAPTPEASQSFKGNSYYTAVLYVPITLPTNKTFVPTFHSCLISRVYQLKLELSLHTGGISGSVDLKLPLQIAYEGSGSRGQRGSVDSRMETDVEEEDVADFFEPRTINAPSGSFVGRSRIGSQAPTDDAPPGYSSFTPGRQGRVSIHVP